MRNSSVTRFLGITLFLSLGLTAGMLLVPAMEGDGFRYVLGVVVFLIIIVLALFIRTTALKRREGGGPDEKQAGSEVGFVVDTFHELVAKLRAKEEELQRLKANAEQKADSMEAYNENVLQSVPSGVVSIDNEMKIRSVNQAACGILGISSGAAVGAHFREVFIEPVAALIAGGVMVSRGEYQYVTRDGRHVWLGITTSRLKNPDGERIGLIIVFTDLTEIKALQEQVELRRRLSQLGEMSAGISHELRNSMSVISGYAKLLGRTVDPSVKPTVDEIAAEIGHMDKIISELLAFAKPTVLHRERTDLNKVLKEAVSAAAGDNDRVQVTVSVPEEETIVEADEVLLRQAFSNLCINAVEEMKDGGRLDIRLECLHGRVEISVSDTGPGIPPEAMHKIFLPFYTTKDSGIGLGLALVQKIILSHDGNISVDSGEGRGTTFRITLPSEA